METTKNCSLKKPGQDDFYAVQDFDDNMETIDEHIGALESPAYEESKELEELESGEPYLSVLGKIKKAVGALIAHISDKNNPHGVTLTQLGAAAADTLSRHIQNRDNPHSVTKTQVGLGKCDNTADATKSVKYAALAGTADNANGMTVIKQGWKGRYTTSESILYCIHGDDDRIWMGCSVNDTGKEMAVQWSNHCDYATRVNDGSHNFTASDIYAWLIDRYCKSEIDSAFAQRDNNINSRLPLSGGALTGDLNMGGKAIGQVAAIYAQDNNDARELTNGTFQVLSKNWASTMDARCNSLRYSGSLNHESYRGAKENITAADAERIKRILDIPVEVFDYRPGFGSNKKDVVGMIVDEVQDVIPEAVIIPDDWDETEFNELLGDMGNKAIPGIDYTVFVPYLIGLVQLQQQQIDNLKTRCDALEKKIK